MKTHPFQNDLIPLFDFRDGGDCDHLRGKTWGEMGLRWNAFSERSLSGSRFRPESLGELLSEASRKGETVIAAGLYNYGTDIIVSNDHPRKAYKLNSWKRVSEASK